MTTRTDGDTRSPAYPWLLCGSLGFAACALYYLLGFRVGWRWDWADAAALWVAITFGLPGLGGLLEALPVIVGAFARGFLAADDDEPGDVADEQPAPRTSPLVGGYLLDEPEAYIYDGLLRLFQHAAAAGSLTSTALIPAAFVDGKQWVYWTDLAAKSGLCVKVNGRATVLPAGRTFAWAVGEIRKGNIIWPSADDPTPAALPHPFRAGLNYNPMLDKAEKAPLKPDKVLDDDD